MSMHEKLSFPIRITLKISSKHTQNCSHLLRKSTKENNFLCSMWSLGCVSSEGSALTTKNTVFPVTQLVYKGSVLLPRVNQKLWSNKQISCTQLDTSKRTDCKRLSKSSYFFVLNFKEGGWGEVGGWGVGGGLRGSN